MRRFRSVGQDYKHYRLLCLIEVNKYGQLSVKTCLS
jgi:hypothetical protein